MLEWLVEDKGIEPHIPVFDKGERKDGTFSRSDFAYDLKADHYLCPAGKLLRQFNRNYQRRAPASPKRASATIGRARPTATSAP